MNIEANIDNVRKYLSHGINVVLICPTREVRDTIFQNAYYVFKEEFQDLDKRASRFQFPSGVRFAITSLNANTYEHFIGWSAVFLVHPDTLFNQYEHEKIISLIKQRNNSYGNLKH